MTTLQDFKHSTALSELIAADLGQEPKRAGKWQTFSCPFPGHNHGDKKRSLCVVDPRQGRPGYWKCYGCQRHGSAVDWLKEYRNMTIEKIVQYLRGLALSPAPARPEPMLTAPELNGFWQERAHQFMTTCKENLWGKPGKAALDYLLNERKFSEAMLRTWDIGFNPTTWFDFKRNWGLPVVEGESRKIMLRRGIVIPCFETGIMHYLKIRVLPAELKDDESKYRKVAGSGPGIMGLDTVYNTPVVFATEGEFNLMPLWEGINRLEDWHQFGAISFGSASDFEALRLNAARFLKVQKIISFFDNDNAGQKAIERLKEISGRVEVATLPAKDLAEYHEKGNDIAAWVRYQYQRHAAQNPAR